MAVTDWSATASENTSVGGVNIAEGCPAKGLNNAIRQIMADIKVYVDTCIPMVVDSIDDITEESPDGFYYIKTDDIEE